MRDIFWTLVVIWLVYKLTDIFRNSYGSKKQGAQLKAESQEPDAYQKQQTSAQNRAAEREGEYVDFEEIK